MKKLLPGIAILSGLLFIQIVSNRCEAQPVAGWKEMVAGLSPYDRTSMEYLLPVINSIEGIKYEGFCREDRCILLLFNPVMYDETEKLVMAFAQRKITIHPKWNTTFEMMKSSCDVVADISQEQK